MTVYTCETCGTITSEKGHLCKPVEIKESFVCEYCGAASNDPRHICFPKVAQLKYVCKQCGRAATSKDHVCFPSEISKPLAKAAGKKKSAVKPAAASVKNKKKTAKG